MIIQDHFDRRRARGYELAKKVQIKKTQDGWLVHSEEGNGFYRVSDDFVCDCPDSELSGQTCKHAFAVRYYLDIEKETPTGTETERIRLNYGQAWSTYNQAQVEEGRLFDVLLADLVMAVDTPLQMKGRPRLLLSDQLFVAIKKVYSQMSTRRSSSLFGYAVEKGHITHKPHFNASSVFLRRADITPLLEELVTTTALPLRELETSFAIDSSGFVTQCLGRYYESMYGGKQNHHWIKAHICVGTNTHIISSVKITDEDGADSPQFIPVAQKTIDAGFNVKELSADKAYSSRANLEFADTAKVAPYIPFKNNSNAKRKGSSDVWRKMFYYFKMNEREFLEHYHKRSNVESTFAAMKKKLGETLKSRSHTAQVNELLCKVIAYNITIVVQGMFEAGIRPDFKMK